MSIAALITLGVGPGGTVPYVLTGGLGIGVVQDLIADPNFTVRIASPRRSVSIRAPQRISRATRGYT